LPCLVTTYVFDLRSCVELKSGNAISVSGSQTALLRDARPRTR
jgi:hypothetical protein